MIFSPSRPTVEGAGRPVGWSGRLGCEGEISGVGLGLAGGNLGISTERVRQLERRALAKIRRHPVMVELAREMGLEP